MKKMIAMVMMMCVVMSNVAFGATIGEYEKDQLIRGNFEVVDLNTKATLSEWTEPDLHLYHWWN